MRLQFIEPGKPIQNAFIESFNSRFRGECLNERVFVSLAGARRKIEQWRIVYNQERPHSSLGCLTPHEFATRHPTPTRRTAAARTALPAKLRLAGAVWSAPSADPKPDIFSLALQARRAGRKNGRRRKKQTEEKNGTKPATTNLRVGYPQE